MKWILFLLLISCSDTEDMRLFQTSLSGEGAAPPQIIDGGECISKMPDASGGDVGEGFTCTGLAIDVEETLSRNDGIIVAWVGNDGRDREPGGGGDNPNFLSSLVKIGINYQAVEGGAGNRVVATKLDEILIYPIVSEASVQGVALDENGLIWFTHSGSVRSISKAGVLGVSFVPPNLPNGLAYDPTSQHLYVKSSSGTLVDVLEKDGTPVRTLDIRTSVDQMTWFDGHLWGGYGSNDGPSRAEKYDTDGTPLEALGPFNNSLASEGISFFTSPWDGKTYLYYANDAYYHPATNPDLELNMVEKLFYN